MNYVDAHAHIWTPDTTHYPLAAGYSRADMRPGSFTAEELLRQARPAGVSRVNLIQMSFYGTNNRYLLDMIQVHKGVFAGTAVIDPAGRAPDRLMGELAKQGVRAFRIYPGLERGTRANAGTGEGWLRAEGYAALFAAGARNNQAMSCLINPDGLPELDRMCIRYPHTPVIVDHLCRIGASGEVRNEDVQALCALAKHRRVMVKVGAFYALGKKKAPYTDLGPLIEKVVRAYGPERCMWESDSPFQTVEGHRYADSVDLVARRLAFLTAAGRAWLLGRTAERFFFPK